MSPLSRVGTPESGRATLIALPRHACDFQRLVGGEGPNEAWQEILAVHLLLRGARRRAQFPDQLHPLQ